VGRVYGVSHHNGELYALRLLLSVTKGATSFEDLATCDGVIHTTFRSACFARGMMADDTELIATFEEIVETTVSVGQLRKCFVTMLLHGGPHDPRALFDRFVDDLSDRPDSQHHVAEAMHAVEDIMQTMGRSLTETDFGFILPELPDMPSRRKRRRRDITQISAEASRLERDRLLPLFTTEQHDALREVVNAIGTGELEHERVPPASKRLPVLTIVFRRRQQRFRIARVSWMREDSLCQRPGSILPCDVALGRMCCRQCVGCDAADRGDNGPFGIPSPDSLQ
jgi:hypothetical protein